MWVVVKKWVKFQVQCRRSQAIVDCASSCMFTCCRELNYPRERGYYWNKGLLAYWKNILGKYVLNRIAHYKL